MNKNNPEIIIRKANVDDVPEIFNCIKFIGLHHDFKNTDMVMTIDLLKKNLFEKKYAEVLVATLDSKIIGDVIYFYNFHSTLGQPGIYIEDLFVYPEYRIYGVGLKLIKEICKIAIEKECKKISWCCLNWNKIGLNFYKRIGATTLDDWIIHELSFKTINKLSSL